MPIRPLLSVIIPTADRQEYAIVSVQAVLRVCPEAEVVISDASRDDLLAEYLATEISQGRVRYGRYPPGLSVVDNFERALALATGEYLIFIGDDDSIGPNVAEIARWARERQIDSVISYGNTFVTCYYWPGVQSRYFGDGYSAKLLVWPFSSEFRPIDADAEMKAALRNLGSGLGLMPRTYHGMISRTVVERIVAKYGSLFGGVSPDIYSATLISQESGSTWIADYPFILPGTSPRSTAGLGAARSDRSSLYDNPHIQPFKNLEWDPLIPEFYHPSNVWAYSFKKAVDRLGRTDLQPNFPRLYARCLISAPRYWKYVLHAFRAFAKKQGAGRSVALLGYEIARETVSFGWRAARRLMAFRVGGAEADAVGNLPTIGDAYDAIDRYVKSRGRGLSFPPLPDR